MYFLVDFAVGSVILYIMKATVKVLMERDGLSREDAIKRVSTFFRQMAEAIETGDSPSKWENIFVEEFGLEPDFFEDFIFRI